MKSEPREMIEGPEAWERFQAAPKALLSVPKSAILKDDKRRARAGSPALLDLPRDFGTQLLKEFALQVDRKHAFR